MAKLPAKRIPGLSGKLGRVLRDTQIDEAQPGSILRDFQVLLDFVGDGLPSAGKHHLLPMRRLTELNARLSRPIELRLKRPQQRSYPYIQGLYLLGRATELVFAEGSGTKARLVRNDPVLASWAGLNPTERYFTLLEAWLLRARPEMIAQRGGWRTSMYYEVFQLWNSVPAEGLEVQPIHECAFSGDFGHQPALMDLFGLLELEHGSPRAGKPWCPRRARRRLFGEALFQLIARRLMRPWLLPGELLHRAEEKWEDDAVAEEDSEEDHDRDEEELEDEDLPPDEGEPAFGQWQAIFQPYFPEWRNNLVIPGPEFREGTFVFRASLGRTWRRIAIPADGDLDDLANAILNSMDFDHDHLWCFEYRDRRGAAVRAEGPRYAASHCDGLNLLDASIGELPLTRGDGMTFVYDFGDNWQFDVKLERVDPPDEAIAAATILDAKGDPPAQYGSWDEEGWVADDPDRDAEDEA